MMKVLVVHNKYRSSAPSGEDGAVLNESRMLAKRGVEVISFERCNDDLDESTLLAKASMAVETVWSRRSRADFRSLVGRERPDVVHVHNTFAKISPSVYGVCSAVGVPVVQTLHNFRLFCPGALFLRDGRPCEDCVDRSLLQAVRHRCYRNSLAATTTLAAMLTLNRAIGSYANNIDRYIALTQFARDKAERAGIPAGKLVVKPNFIPNPPPIGSGGGPVLFVGRLLEGKGTETLLRAWKLLPDIPLKIIGDGALRSRLEAMAQSANLNVEFVGRLDRAAVLAELGDARLLVTPSEWYEGFPMVVAEAYACGTPIIASRIGSLNELVEEGITGAKFPPGDAGALAAAVRSLFSDTVRLKQMRIAARDFFDKQLTEEQNFNQLTGIYADVIGSRSSGRRAC